MRFKNRKWASPFFIVSLAVAGLFGASATVVNKQIEDTLVAEKAEAAAPGYVYLKWTDNVWKGWGGSPSDVRLYIYGGSTSMAWGSSPSGTKITVADGTEYLKFDLTGFSNYGTATNYIFHAWWPDDNTKQNRSNTTPSNGKNAFIFNSSSTTNYQTGTWSFHADSTISSKTYYFDVKSWGLSNSDTVQVRFFDDIGDYEELSNASLVKNNIYRFYSKATTKNWNKVIVHINGGWSKQTSDLTLPTDTKDFYVLGSDIWIKQDATFWYDYQYRCGDESWIPLLYNDDGLNRTENKVQFSPSEGHVLTKNKFLTYRYSTNNGSTWISLTVTTYSGWNNNYSTETGIKLTTNDTIFLKITNSGVYDCWVPGVTDYTVRVDYGSGQGVYSMVGWGHSGGGKEQMKATTLVQGLKDTKLDIGYEGNYYRGYRNGGCFGIEERTISGETNLYFTVNGMFEVYLIKEDGEHWDNIYVSIDNDASATMFGNEFMDWVECDPTGRTLPTYWDRVATFYGNLADDTKDIVYNTIGSETGTVVERAVARYDYAVAHHPELDKFIKDSGGTPRFAVNITRQFNPIDVLSEDGGGTTIIIIVASSVSLLSITALSVLLVKKRKRKEY